MTQNPCGNSQHFELIDILRGFAAISILVYHVIEVNDWKDFPKGYGLLWFIWGWMGTDIFFVISGFVITLSALNILAKNNGDQKKTLYVFGEKRIRRLVPLHYLTLILFIIFANRSLLNLDNWHNLIAHLLFIHNWFPEYHRSLNAPNWTLGVEAQFYLVLICIIPYVTYKNLKYFVAGAFIIAFAWRAGSFYTTATGSLEAADKTFMAATQLPGMLDFFACGMLTAFMIKADIFQYLKNNRILKLFLLAIIVSWGFFSFHVFTTNASTYWINAHTVIFPRSMLAILFTLLVILLCTFNISPNIKKILAPLVYLGTISYGIYLFHWPVLRFIYKWNISNPCKLTLTLLITLVVASISWHFYEKKFIKRSS